MTTAEQQGRRPQGEGPGQDGHQAPDEGQGQGQNEGQNRIPGQGPGQGLGRSRTRTQVEDHDGAGERAGGRVRGPGWARRRPVAVATALAAVLHVVWFLWFANSGGDLAAQDAWAEFAGRHPDSAYNLAWYGGMHPVSYSVISPYVMHVLGVRTTMMIAGTVSAGLLALVLTRCRGAVREPLWPALAGVYGLFCNALSGRVTFGLGVMFALGAVAAVFCRPRKRSARRWAKAVVTAVLAALATASSPVAGLFLGVIAAALFLNGRRPGAYALGLPPTAVVALSAWLFPFSGTQPMRLGSAWLPFVFALAVLFFVPKAWRTVRTASAVYAFGVFLTWAVDSQVGSNVTRLVMLFGGAALLAALPYVSPRAGSVPRVRPWRRWALLFAFAGLTAWITTNGVTDIIRTTPVAAWNRELAPLVDQLRKAGAERGRVEVVPVSSHRESSAFPPHVTLARGWNRQADLERNPLFYDGTLTADSYRAWLDRWAVHYVVLPADRPDAGGKDEAELVRQGLPYLQQVWGDAHWQLFKVREPAELVTGPARVVRAGADQLVLDVGAAGRVRVRIPYSPWLGLVDAAGRPVAPPQGDANTAGCLSRAEPEPDGTGDVWTELLAPGPGQYRVAAKYQLPRGTPCPDGLLPTAPRP